MAKKKSLIVLLIIGVSIVFLSLMFSMANYLVSGIAPFTKAVAVIKVEGVIVDSEDIMRKINEFREDDEVVAVVLRVDSPGGGVAASQEIYEELKKLSEEKVLVTSMGNIAASGGYYIACASDYIFANPGTTTGSIGVIIQTINIEEALDKLGIEGVVLTSGKYKDIGSPLREMTPEERAFFQKFIDNIFQQFINTVATERKLTEEEVRKIADARILTGEQALELKLVDELGNLEDAIDKAAELSGIKGKPRVIYPKKKEFSLFSLLLGETKTKLIEDISIQTFRVDYRFAP